MIIERPNLEAESDGVLVGRVVNGDSEAAAVLIRRHQKALHGFLRRVAPDAADDLFQETWIRAMRGAPRFDPSYPFPPWLFRIAWNLVRTDWKGRETTEDVAETPEVASEVIRADDDLLARERASRVRLLIRELPPRLAEAVFLRYYEDLSEKQMAERLGVPRGTIKSRLHNALRRLGLAATKEFS
ncbi:MAG: sigma-70 family RNA polymerase sigma factor [Acidobacteriota bacterium]|nr:sigma-70 family RNA polymerase sigma factor [Acidobacteriota bacterium]